MAVLGTLVAVPRSDRLAASTALRSVAALLTCMFFLGCTTNQAEQPGLPVPTTPAPPTTATPPSNTAPTTTSPAAPAWQVGARPLPLRADGFGQVLPTPPELVRRGLPTLDLLPPPAGEQYASTVRPVPPGVLARSTWQRECPVRADELRYLTMSFWGFDGRQHTGEMLVNARAADTVTAVFRELHQARFPIEEMRVTRKDELDLAPTGDGNNTNAFVCRPARGQTRWSAHAYGLAIDLNPFCNPYVKGDLVLPELASAYLDRANRRPGMITAGDPAHRAFTQVGWAWGGTWREPSDIMHFSATGD
jgi:hypothetical protein